MRTPTGIQIHLANHTHLKNIIYGLQVALFSKLKYTLYKMFKDTFMYKDFGINREYTV